MPSPCASISPLACSAPDYSRVVNFAIADNVVTTMWVVVSAVESSHVTCLKDVDSMVDNSLCFLEIHTLVSKSQKDCYRRRGRIAHHFPS
ncbi:hypothetical protein VNO77_20092 [Canavalia gladiata]|uniref:Uncharacterized protein n=1 Tax=Canavalia gladiata TaxID=3824 RepID=A0AAN9LSV0_CANGL